MYNKLGYGITKSVTNREVEHRVEVWVGRWETVLVRPMPDFSWIQIVLDLELQDKIVRVVRGIDRNATVVYPRPKKGTQNGN